MLVFVTVMPGASMLELIVEKRVVMSQYFWVGPRTE